MNEIELKQEVMPVVQRAGEIVVRTPEDYTGAASFLKAVKETQKRVTEFFAPLAAKAHEAHKAITSKQAETMKPLNEAEQAIKRKMLDYATEQEAIRQKEQARLQEQADLAARRERERLEKEAQKLKTPELKAARMEQAQAVVAPVVEVAKVTPVVAGQSFKTTWRCKVVDAAKVPREWLTVNQQALDAFARSTKGAVPVAGCEMVAEKSLSSGSK